MPWRGPEFPGEFPSLGWAVLDFFEEFLRIPDGPNAGDPFVLTREQAEFCVRLLRVDPTHNRLTYRRAQLRLPKGWGKSPFAAGLTWAMCKAPVVPAGWDSAGEPVGKPWPTPWAQIAATAEDQTVNTYAALYEMARDAPLLEAFPDIDLGDTRIRMAGQAASVGRIDKVTSKAGTREGQRVTWAVKDEPQLWTQSNGGVKLSATIDRNVAKMNGQSLETGNAYTPGQMSVAERTDRAARRVPDILIYGREAPKVADLSKKRELKRALRISYGDSGAFVDLDRLVREIQDPDTAPSDARKFYLNQTDVEEDKPMDPEKWEALAKPRKVPAGSLITLGFDGSKFYDATALRGCVVESGYRFTLGLWERPEGPAAGWEVPADEVDAAVAAAFAEYDVWRMYADPPYWEDYIDRWIAQYGEKRVVKWWTNRTRQMHDALDRITTAVRSGEAPHDGDPRVAEHWANAHKKHVGRNWIIQKDGQNSPRKIDAAMADTLAYEARGDAIAAGAKPRRRRRRMISV